MWFVCDGSKPACSLPLSTLFIRRSALVRSSLRFSSSWDIRPWTGNTPHTQANVPCGTPSTPVVDLKTAIFGNMVEVARLMRKVRYLSTHTHRSVHSSQLQCEPPASLWPCKESTIVLVWCFVISNANNTKVSLRFCNHHSFWYPYNIQCMQVETQVKHPEKLNYSTMNRIWKMTDFPGCVGDVCKCQICD